MSERKLIVIAITGILLCIIALWLSRHRLEAIFIALIPLFDLSHSLLNLLTNRPIPSGDLIHIYEMSDWLGIAAGSNAHTLLFWGGTRSLSFPSGHVVHFTLLFGFLLYLVSTQRRPGFSRTALQFLLISLILAAFAVVIGCAGSYGKIKNQSRAESKATQQELTENWSNYHIWFRSTVIVFDPKTDDKQIAVGKYWGTVTDQATWTQIVEQNTSADGTISPIWANYAMTNVREIWGPQNQLYGYVIHQQSDLVSATVIDENTIKINYRRASFGGP